MTEQPAFKFSTSLPITLYRFDLTAGEVPWQYYDEGPGYFNLEPGIEFGVQTKYFTDQQLGDLVNDLIGCRQIVYLNLSENRKITDEGILALPMLSNLKNLNLSSCDITNKALVTVANLGLLESLNLSYSTRITDVGLKPLSGLRNLTYLDLQGCPKITHAGVNRISAKNLKIHY
jgi:hypothetical protein